MIKTTFKSALIVLFLFFSFEGISQTYKPFTVRENLDVKGSMLVIGNNILGQNNLPFNDLTKDNQDVSMQYIDIDGDNTTFSSSSADLLLSAHQDGTPTTCYRVAYAALYWAATLQSGNRANINQVKLKVPGSSTYTNITGEVIYDAIINPIIANTNEPGNTPYACYADITGIMSGLSGIEGTYTVANVTSSLGFNNSTGLSAGWTLFVIYEDPLLHTKSFTTFDGFSHIYDGHQETIPVSGFRTPPVGNIDLQFAYGTLDGDRTKRATKLEINGKEVTTPLRPANKFFGSVIENTNGVSNPRNPMSDNTLGYDTGFLEILNSEPEFIKNNVTSADFRLQVARGQADPIFAFFSAFAVDIIAPDIDLTKIVVDTAGNNIDGTDVVLGQNLFYEISYQSVGNDNVTQFTIKDVLPDNIVFNPLTDIDLTNAGGATLQSYDPVTRTLIFNIPDASVEVNDPKFVIRIAVQVVPNCYDLSQACSNEIMNQAFATYRGVINPTIIQDEGSFATTECLGVPGSTNFLVDISNCSFERTEVLCGANVILRAADGYDSYSWSTSASGTPVVGTGQTYTATATGTYYVTNTTSSTCISIREQINVIAYGNNITNPIIPYADLLPIYPNDGKVLPYIFLCGANDVRSIVTGISDSVSIIWEKLNEASCAAVTEEDCANENTACTWNQVGTGPNFTVDTAGQFRVVINYPGGCFRIFYFNVYQNLLVPTITAKDIICNNLGEITVGGVPSGYEYSLSPVGPYQLSNVFSISTANYYTVYIRQIGVDTNPCIFQTPSIYVRDRDFSISTIITQPNCNGEKGSVKLAANNVRPQYFYSIYQGATLINNVGPVMESDYTFSNLNPGNYTATVSTEDGCTETIDIQIINPPLLTVTSALTKPLTCTDGEITVYPVGGTPPYYFYVNSTTDFQSTPVITVTTAGVYNITVVDTNNCSAETSITVAATLAPDFNITKTDILCSDAGNVGTINVNVTNANGNSLLYSIDNGLTFFNSPVFTGLAAGTYDVVVQYSIGTDVCTSVPQPIIITTTTAISGTATLTAPYTCTSNGVITVSGVSGGTAPYTYSIDGVNYQSGLTFSGLVNGTYTVTIKDALDCSNITTPITINSLNFPTDLSFSSTTLSCPSITSNVTLTATGGVGTLEYQIIAPAALATLYQTSNVFNGLTPNTYTFRVRDANNCFYSETYTIAPLVPIRLNTILAKDLDCTASPNATITGTFTGGVAPFTYAVSINGASYNSLGTVTSPFSYSAPTPGTYQFQITDANGCTTQSSVQNITAIELVSVSSSGVNPTCNGFSDGSISLSGLTGLAPFTYSIDGGITFVSSNVFGGLVAGTYNYVVRDSKNCVEAGTVNLIDPAPLNVSIVRNAIQCNSNVPGSLVATINSGGVTPFTYTLYDSTYTQIGSSIITPLTTHNFGGLSFGDYYVTIIDSRGCEYRSARQRIETPPNIQLDGNATTGSCATGATVDISVITGIGPFTYSIYGQPATSFGPTALNSYTFTGLDHGVTYQFQVLDAGGCYSIIEVTTPILSAIDIAPITTTHVNCNGGNDGSVNFTIFDYDSSVTSIYYEVRDELTNVAIIPAQNGTFNGLTGTPVSGSVVGLPAGNYTLFIREANGTLCTVSKTFQITQPIQPLFSVIADEINANCSVGSQITLITTGSTGPYQYASGAPGFTPLLSDFGTSNILNLDYNIRTNWDIVIRDSNGCEVRINKTIDIDPSPIITATSNNQCTAVEGSFAIDVALATPGTAPYAYSIDGGAFQTRTAPFTISNLASGNHTVEVRDANGCGNLVSIDIVGPLNLATTLTTLPTCNDNDGIITMTGSGGTGSYTYTINPLAGTVSGNVISGLPSGTYTITITDTTTLCEEIVEVFLPSANLPIISIGSPTQVTCFGAANGAFEINVNGYSGPYTFEVFNSSGTSINGIVSANTSTNPLLVTGIEAGNYTVLVTQTASPFCSATSNVVTIASPVNPLTLTATETSNVTCDNNTGTITAVATGGYGTYQYELTGSATVAYSPSGTFRNLSAGNYTINVMDAGGCMASNAVTLSVPAPINATVSANTTLLSCFGNTNATITASAISGGQGSNYSYTLHTVLPTVTSSGPQVSPVFNGLGVGTYYVVVTDGYNCEFTSPNIVITQPTQVEATLVKSVSQTCSANSILTLSATGGTGTYEYSNTANFATILGTFSSSSTISVAPGTYMYYVRDVNGCVANVSNEIKIDPLPALVANLDVTNATINCVGDTTGAIVARAQGGLGSYIYTLQDGAGVNIPTATQNSPGVFTELPIGTYQVRVDSGDCLTTSIQVTITQPATPLTANFVAVDITCPGTNNGRLEITASGGTGTIKYAISPRMDQFFQTSVFENLSPGNYQAMAQDELGCFIIYDFTLNEPLPVALTIVPNSILPEACTGDLDGEFSIDISGGNMPYSVVLDDINGVYTTGLPTQTQFDFDGLAGGDHIVYVRDALGCESEWNITFPESVLIEPEVEVVFGCENNISTNTVTVTVDASTVSLTDLDYSLNGGAYQTSNIFINVPAGANHIITVRHTNGCEKPTLPFNIEPYSQLALILENGDLNEIVALTTGGSGDYEYTLNGESRGSTNRFLINESGNYTVTVTDSYGCFASASGYFEFIDLCIPNYFEPNIGGWKPGCASQYRNLTVNIFDRYGRKVATLGVDDLWDGKYNGVELPTGDYWYVVVLNEKTNNREFVGHFTLYR